MYTDVIPSGCNCVVYSEKYTNLMTIVLGYSLSDAKHVCSSSIYTALVMWRAMHRVALRQGTQTCRTFINAHSRRRGLHCLRNDHHFRGNGILGQFHRWSSGSSVTVGAEPFLSGSSGSYVEAMYESWQKDRSSVHKVTAC